MTEGLRVTVAGWVSGTRVAFEVSDVVHERLQSFRKALGLTHDELVSRITRGRPRSPTEQQVIRFLDRQTE